MINLYPCEAISYSWNLNRDRGNIAKVILAIGASVASVFCCYKIEKEVRKYLPESSDNYKNSYFLKSLKERGINITEPSVSKGVFGCKSSVSKGVPVCKIVVDGVNGCGKNSFINVVRGLSYREAGAASVGKSEKQDTEMCYKFSDEISLCTLPSSARSMLTFDHYNAYDAIIILFNHKIYDYEMDLIKLANESGKPYLIVRTKIDYDVLLADCSERYGENNERKDDIPSIDSSIIVEKVRKDVSDILKIETDNLMPTNGKALVVSNQLYNNYELEEVKQLISSKNFNGNNV